MQWLIGIWGKSSGKRFCNLKLQRVFLLDFAHYKGALNRCHILDNAQFVEHKLLILFHIGGAHLEQIIVRT